MKSLRNTTDLFNPAEGVGACREGLLVEDTYAGKAISIIHLATDADIKRIHVEGAKQIEMADNYYSIEYNRFIPCKVLYIYFENRVKYFIS